MKKVLRVTALVLVVSTLLLTLCGCGWLDEMKKTHGLWNDDGSISLGDSQYLLLPYDEYLNPEDEDNIWVYVTDKSVPVLMSRSEGERMTKSDDGVFLVNEMSEDFITKPDEEDTWPRVYCRADKFEEIEKQIENGVEYNEYYYSYEMYDADTAEWATKRYYLTDIEAGAVNDILSFGEEMVLPEYTEQRYDRSYAMYHCSDNGYFNYYAFNLCSYNSNYYLVVESWMEKPDDYSVSSVNRIYEVPYEFHSVFNEIMKAGIEGEESIDRYFDNMEPDNDIYYHEDEYLEDEF